MCIPNNYYQHNFSDTTGLAIIFDKHKHGSNKEVIRKSLYCFELDLA